jgi:hypothetical protein
LISEKQKYFWRAGLTDFQVICPSGGFVELVRQFYFFRTGLFVKNFRADADEIRFVHPLGVFA